MLENGTKLVAIRRHFKATMVAVQSPLTKQSMRQLFPWTIPKFQPDASASQSVVNSSDAGSKPIQTHNRTGSKSHSASATKLSISLQIWHFLSAKSLTTTYTRQTMSRTLWVSYLLEVSTNPRSSRKLWRRFLVHVNVCVDTDSWSAVEPNWRLQTTPWWSGW